MTTQTRNLTSAVLVAAALTACGPSATAVPTNATPVARSDGATPPSPGPASSPEPLETPTRQLADDADGWPTAAVGPVYDGELTTYTSVIYDYALDYPADWHIDFANPDVVMLMSFPPEQAGSDGIPDDEVKIDILASPGVSFSSPDQFAETLRAQSQAVLRFENWQLAGVTKALRMDTKGDFGDMASLYAVFGNNAILLNGFGDLEAFDIVARTVRPAGTGLVAP